MSLMIRYLKIQIGRHISIRPIDTKNLTGRQKHFIVILAFFDF